MQQRQLRLGDILDDYCPRERRLTNHAVVAMVGNDVKQTRCTTCDTEHEYKHAKVPRQRRKDEGPAALYAQVAAGAPKRVVHDQPQVPDETMEAAGEEPSDEIVIDESAAETAMASAPEAPPESDPQHDDDGDEDESVERGDEEGPIHRRLIRASLPRPEGQQPPARPIPEFTIRQPGGRPNRFRPRHGRGGGGGGQGQGQHGHQFGGNRSNGNMGGGAMRGGRPNVGRPGGGGVAGRRGPGGGRKRSK
jgi:hypothetical protein